METGDQNTLNSLEESLQNLINRPLGLENLSRENPASEYIAHLKEFLKTISDQVLQQILQHPTFRAAENKRQNLFDRLGQKPEAQKTLSSLAARVRDLAARNLFRQTEDLRASYEAAEDEETKTKN